MESDIGILQKTIWYTVMKNSFFHLHPVSTFLYFLVQFILILVSDHPVFLGLCFLQAATVDISFRGIPALKSILRFNIPFVVFCSLFNSLFSHYGVTVLFVLPSGNSYTLESLIYGLVTGVKITVMLLWLDCFNEIISPEKFIYIFGRFSPRLAVVLSMSLRFIPMFRKQSKEIEEARRSLGLSSKDRNVIRRFRNSVSNLSILITWILERGIDTAASMNARGYGSGRRSSYSPYYYSSQDFVLIILSTLSIIFFIVNLGVMKCVYNPVIRIPQPEINLYFFLFFSLFYGLFPVLYNYTEKKKWTS